MTGLRVRWAELPSGLRLRVAEAGDPRARPVLLLHGWGASIYMWRSWFAPLAAAGWRPIAVDLPGHGLSDKPRTPGSYRLASQVEALRQLLSVERLTDVAVVAQSMAGTIALELALAGEPRVSRMVLVNPASFGRVRIQAMARLISPPVLDLVLHRLVGRWVVSRAQRLVYADPSRLTSRDEEEYWAPSQFPSYAHAMRRLLHEFAWRRPPHARMAERLRRLTVPTLVVLGTRDRLIREAGPYVAALLREGAPLAVREVPGGGHAVNEERAEEVLELVLDFLSRTEAR